MDFWSDDLERLYDRALEDSDVEGGHWAVALGDEAVVKVPISDDVSRDVVETNISLANELGVRSIDTELRDNLGDDFAQVQTLGVDAADYCERDEEDFLSQVTCILDYVAEKTDYIIDAKLDNFVVVDGTVFYGDLGDGASFTKRNNGLMFNRFIASYRREMGAELTEADRKISKYSDYFETDIPEIALD